MTYLMYLVFYLLTYMPMIYVLYYMGNLWRTLMNQELHLHYIWSQSNKLALNFQKLTILFSIEQGLTYKIRPSIYRWVIVT